MAIQLPIEQGKACIRANDDSGDLSMEEEKVAYLRLADPPKKIAEEQNRLLQEYLDQFSDDDEIPDGGPEEYLWSHASPALRAYMKKIDRIIEKAQRGGYLV